MIFHPSSTHVLAESEHAMVNIYPDDTSLIFQGCPRFCLCWCWFLERRPPYDSALFAITFCSRSLRQFAFRGDIYEYSQCPHFSLISFSHFLSIFFCLWSSAISILSAQHGPFHHFFFSLVSKLLAKCILPGRFHTPELTLSSYELPRMPVKKCNKCICFEKTKIKWKSTSNQTLD